MKKAPIRKYFHVSYVEEKFTEVFSRYVEDQKIIKKLFNNVLRAYSSNGRYYHDMHHIFHMVNLWEAYKQKLQDPDAIFMAIIYHDIVYSVIRKNNEENSAKYFIGKVMSHIKGLDVASTLRVSDGILATKHGEKSKLIWDNDSDIKFLLDFDLDILGTRHDSEYEYYRTGVRKEYSIYPLRLYKKGRKAVLESFLKRDSIYLTDDFRQDREKKARKNLQNEINTYLC